MLLCGCSKKAERNYGNIHFGQHKQSLVLKYRGAVLPKVDEHCVYWTAQGILKAGSAENFVRNSCCLAEIAFRFPLFNIS